MLKSKEEVFKALDENPQAVFRAIRVIYENQTYEEKQAESSIDHNNKGFDTIDCYFFTGILKQLNSTKKISPELFYRSRNRIKKYWKQLIKASERKEQENETIQQARQELFEQQIQNEQRNSIVDCMRDNCGIMFDNFPLFPQN